MNVRRIRRPKDQEEKYKELVNMEEFGIFLTYKDIFMTAGTLGFMEKKRKAFTGSAEGIPWNVFSLSTDEAIINSIALAETNDITILSEEQFDMKLTIFEEYAAGGLELLYNRLMENPKQALNTYFNMIVKMEKEEDEKTRNLKGIADMLSF
ncbi:DNA phosphorothioation-associated protein 4 [Alkalihalophilus pseudofirmus]|uniref:DNA phosphorothioation-associated protein 4 n=1 Tax=Alkalihalophilus pseudofirmus TaxID=79885 RepID=A0AAJ2KU21_ALKPS|nr:DNA phosphorothioation-associated protein 4 [Alkalihalophilus pseudofirmus]MDV2884679.1 DNA phosphorothioation-associated protein 4 [Alkalihalophilus pseudofirmus]